MVLIIIPQLVRIALPGMTNLWVILLKDTSYVSIIGLADIIRQTGIAARVSKEAFFFTASPACSISFSRCFRPSASVSSIAGRASRR